MGKKQKKRHGRRQNLRPYTFTPSNVFLQQEKRSKWLLLLLIFSSRQLVDSFVCPPTIPVASTYKKYSHSSSSVRAKTNNQDRDDDKGFKSDKDTAERLEISKNRAISALSQPNQSNSKNQTNKRKNKFSKEKRDGSSYNSLLPPPMKGNSLGQKDTDENNNSLSDGLSSWEDFLGATSSDEPTFASPSFGKTKKNLSSSVLKKKRKKEEEKFPNNKDKKKRQNLSSYDDKEELPSIADLFPPDLYNTPSSGKKGKGPKKKIEKTSTTIESQPPPSLDGVLPVSDLFYRSSQAMNDNNEETTGDDDELPFSAEQSDQLTTVHNKIKIRRNQAKSPSKSSSSPSKPTRQSQGRKFSAPRKMVRRGMEMLVGGVPINADPPQRYIDLLFNSESVDWDKAILINSRDFGPMYHTSSVKEMSKVEKGLFCEHFVHSTLKWDVCPADLKTIVKSYTSSLMDELNDSMEDISSKTDSSIKSLRLTDDDLNELATPATNSNPRKDDKETSGVGFGKLKSFNKPSGSKSNKKNSNSKSRLGGELVFSIGVSSEELKMGDTPEEIPVLQRVLARGIATATECKGFDVLFNKLTLTDMDDGTTMISGEFTLTLTANESMSRNKMEKKAQSINSSLAQAMDDGDLQLAMAAAAKEETGWPDNVRDRVVEEFLFDDDDGDGPLDEEEEASDDKLGYSRGDQEQTVNSLDILNDLKDEYDGPFGMPGSQTYHKDDLFLGGGNDGVFWDYSKKNSLQSPYQGNLGLRLVDAAVQRAKERYPRVIAIGDVHGCIDELQDLLRECDYRPGDLIVFLGDLVSKGPDSISVVQMAREIGAIGVRGNHDFEVVRWHQAIKSGVDPPVVGSEHFHIASCLSKADMKWMYSLPWYISSKELGTLFVHAGFVSGIRLAKQNPRLMMNMRSILPDGTVTSKFFNNWPWARLWDGPQTVLFGHDADRGLQQYEHAIGLDTGCVYGGRLTACILPEKRLVSVSARREYFKYRRKHYD